CPEGIFPSGHFFILLLLSIGSKAALPVRQKTPLRKFILCLSEHNGRLSFSFCPASATCSSNHTLLSLCGKKRHFVRSSYVCRSITVASAFLFVQLRRLVSRVASDLLLMAKNAITFKSSSACRDWTDASAFLFILHNIPAAFFDDGLDAKQLESCLLAPF